MLSINRTHFRSITSRHYEDEDDAVMVYVSLTHNLELLRSCRALVHFIYNCDPTQSVAPLQTPLSSSDALLNEDSTTSEQRLPDCPRTDLAAFL